MLPLASEKAEINTIGESSQAATRASPYLLRQQGPITLDEWDKSMVANWRILSAN